MSLLNKEDLEILVSRSLGNGFQILNYHLEPFTENKNGIFGNHQLLTLNLKADFNDEIDARTQTFFVKTPPEPSTARKNLLDKELFIEEIHFYEEIYPILTENNDDDRQRWSPKFYLIKGDVLVFEDLRSKGYRMRQDVPLDDMDFLKAAISALARFHAASIFAEMKIGKTLRDAYPNAFVEKLYTDSTIYSRCTDLGFETIVLLAEKFGIETNLIKKFYKRTCEMVRYREGRLNVINHGDLWKNNILLKENSTPNCLLVDYQLLRYTSPTCDICMLLYLHSTPNFRKSYEFELFDYYYSVLCNRLLTNKSLIKPTIPSYDELLKDYKESRLIGMIYAAHYLPGIYLKPEDFSTLLNDSDELEKWLFSERFSVIESTIKSDPIYEKKLKNVIEELFEEGRRIFSN